MIELGGGQAAKGIIDVYPGKTERKPIQNSVASAKRTMGVEYTLDQIVNSFNSIGI